MKTKLLLADDEAGINGCACIGPIGNGNRVRVTSESGVPLKESHVVSTLQDMRSSQSCYPTTDDGKMLFCCHCRTPSFASASMPYHPLAST